MIPPRLGTEAVARELEAIGHQVGWDNFPPRLLYLVGMVEDGNLKALGLAPFPVPEDVFAEYGGQRLRRLGQAMLSGVMRKEIHGMAKVVGAGFAGAAFLMEGYVGAPSPEVRAGKRLADIPGSLEARFAFVFDCAGHVVECRRIRGKEPTVRTSEPGGDVLTMQGNVMEGLRDVVLSVAMHLPLGTADLDAIRGAVVDLKEFPE